MALQEFRLPDLGEGLTEGEILAWLVAPGDTVTLNQPIVEVETAKAAVEIPSPFAGTVAELLHPAGSTVDVGSPIIRMQTGADPAPGPAPTAGRPAAAAQALAAGFEAGATQSEAGASRPVAHGSDREAVLVGYGVRTSVAHRRARRSGAVATAAGRTAPPPPPPPPPARISAAAVGSHAADLLDDVAARARAKPPVRLLAKQLGVDLRALTGTGPAGLVTRADVEAAAAGRTPVASPMPDPAAGAEPTVAAPSPGFTAGRVALKGIRKATAAAMVASAFTAPHVTEWLDVDVTEVAAVRARLAGLPEFAGAKVSPLLLAARAFVLALRRHPQANASLDADAGEIVLHGQVNLGIAAATPRGLLVPTIRAADRMDLVSLARALAELTATARAGRTRPDALTGGTATITNIGVFGIDAGTPILNPGESVILSLGAFRERPWVVDGALAVRTVTTLALSFDHRLIDGELGSRVLADTAAMLADPVTMLAYS